MKQQQKIATHEMHVNELLHLKVAKYHRITSLSYRTVGVYVMSI